MNKLLPAALLMSVLGCGNSRDMETRTFALASMEDKDALALLTPYIGDGGQLSAHERTVTVRESPDRLTLIEELLQRYDGGGDAQDIVFKFQVVEADGFTGRDTAIADVEETLRRSFKYSGYRLLGETLVQVREGGYFRQGGDGFTVEGTVERILRAGAEPRVAVNMGLDVPGRATLSSTITATLGKPVVLGQSTSDGAIILVIRPEYAGN